jgi:plasmid maintenance system antidote protein VapI
VWLGRYFKISAQFWWNLQPHYELEVAQERFVASWKKEAKVLAAA